MTARGVAAPIVVIAITGVAVALLWPALHAGIIADDFVQRAMLDGSYPLSRPAWDLYSFVDAQHGELAALLDRGTLPWWSYPDPLLRAFRPLSSLLLALDHVLRLSPFAAHLHNLLWLIALIGVYAALLRRFFPLSVALLATFFLAVNPAHAQPMGWIANRPALVSTALGTVALFGHLQWRERGWRPGAVVSAAMTGLSLAGGEYGLAMVSYPLSYELAASRRPARDRLVASLPFVVPTLAYLALRSALGFGARGSSMYVDPLSAPGWFLTHFVTRFPALLAAEAGVIPAHLTKHQLELGLPWAALPLGVIALASVTAIFALRACEPDERRLLGALTLGAALSLVPLSSTLPATRLLAPVSVGMSVVVAAAARSLWVRRQPSPVAPPLYKRAIGWLARGAVALIVLLHLVAAPLHTRRAAVTWRDVHDLARRWYLSAAIGSRLENQTLVLLSAIEPIALIYPPYVLEEHGRGMPAAFRVLAATAGSITVRRLGSQTLELVAEAGLLSDEGAYLLRDRMYPLRQGEVVSLRGMSVRVVEVGLAGPVRIQYQFDRVLEDPSLTWVAETPNGFERVTLPAVGRTLRLAGVRERQAFTTTR
jgi:hypothetical protein